MGLLGAGFMGSIVFFINFRPVWQNGVTAALKQAAYTFFFGGFIVRLCQHLAVTIKGKWLAYIIAMLVPSLLAIGATFAVHSLRGTPEPLYSTIPTMLTGPPAFLVWGVRKRRKMEKEQADKEVDFAKA